MMRDFHHPKRSQRPVFIYFQMMLPTLSRLTHLAGLLILSGLAGCSWVEAGRGNTTETQNGISVALLNPDLTPAVGARVTLLRLDRWKPQTAAIQSATIATAIADSNGRVELSAPDSVPLILEVSSPGAGAVISGPIETFDSVVTLQHLTNVTLTLLGTVLPDTLWIEGTHYFAPKVNSRYTFPSLPTQQYFQIWSSKPEGGMQLGSDTITHDTLWIAPQSLMLDNFEDRDSVGMLALALASSGGTAPDWAKKTRTNTWHRIYDAALGITGEINPATMTGANIPIHLQSGQGFPWFETPPNNPLADSSVAFCSWFGVSIQNTVFSARMQLDLAQPLEGSANSDKIYLDLKSLQAIHFRAFGQGNIRLQLQSALSDRSDSRPLEAQLHLDTLWNDITLTPSDFAAPDSSALQRMGLTWNDISPQIRAISFDSRTNAMLCLDNIKLEGISLLRFSTTTN